MPRISAATVAEHRRNQERRLLDAAHEILRDTGDVPSLREVGRRAGLARSSVYHYFGSREDLLNSLVRDVFPKWTERVTTAMEGEVGAGRKILAYALANVHLVNEGAHAVATALASLTPGEVVDEQAAQMHRAITEPLVEVLAELGVADPEGVSDLINAVVHASARALEAGKPIEQVVANLTAVIAPMADDLQDRARR